MLWSRLPPLEVDRLTVDYAASWPGD